VHQGARIGFCRRLPALTFYQPRGAHQVSSFAAFEALKASPTMASRLPKKGTAP
jgi:hypothetical protein